jgi:hypothetical protein
MRDAYEQASSGGRHPARPRQIMYAARGSIQDKTGKMLNGQYFCQHLLPDYMADHPNETASWDIAWDARGHFTEPHTNRTFGVGTLEARGYLADIEAFRSSELPAMTARLSGGYDYPTCGPQNRYGAILYIEKEGFEPLFTKAKLAGRYDLAIMSNKGLSVTATRVLVDQLCRLCAGGVPLFVLHDFDKSGFSILGTFRRNTRRYSFKNVINVIDLGLRLEDVEAHELESEEVVYAKSNPSANLRINGATEEEIAFLCDQDRQDRPFRGRRVELNAFISLRGDLQGIEQPHDPLRRTAPTLRIRAGHHAP